MVYVFNVLCLSYILIIFKLLLLLQKETKVSELTLFFTVSSIFTVPNVRLQPETGESMRAFGKNNSYGKGVSNSKH